MITVQRALAADMNDDNELIAYALLESLMVEENKSTYEDRMEEMLMRLNEDERLEGVSRNSIEKLIEERGATADSVVKHLRCLSG